MKKYIRVKIWKFSLFQALIPPIFILIFDAFTGFEIPFLFLAVLCSIGALGFAVAGAAIASWALEVVFEDGKIKNTFNPFDRGPVELANAKKSPFADLFFIVLKDNVTKAVARIPKPFWAEDPTLIEQILNRVNDKTDV